MPMKPPSTSTVSTASGQEKPNMVCSEMARMCQSTMPYPTVRSMRPADMGIITPSDRIRMIALSEMIERRLRTVGKVLGRRIEKRTIRRTVRMTSP